jgi:uncharacterized caspase-like protein
MTTPSVGARGRVLADLLAALFEDDRKLADQLNAAQRRLQAANAQVDGEIADLIHRAFTDYQSVAEQRRQLGADVGEATARLSDAMQEAGFSEEQTRHADVRALREGVYRRSPTSEHTLCPSDRTRSRC